jgi:hypothetical protein
MSCILELALAGWGIYLLCTGEMKVLSGKSIRGGLVRVAGVFFMLPFPLAFVIGFYLGFSEGMKGRRFDIHKNAPTLILMELGIIFVCLVIGSILLWLASSQPQEPPYRRRRDISDRDFDRIFTAKPMLDDVQAVAPRKEESVLDVVPVTAGKSEGVTAQPPPLARATVPDMPRRTPVDDFDTYKSEPLPRRASVSPVMIIAAVMVFVIVAVVGAVAMK